MSASKEAIRRQWLNWLERFALLGGVQVFCKYLSLSLIIRNRQWLWLMGKPSFKCSVRRLFGLLILHTCHKKSCVVNVHAVPKAPYTTGKHWNKVLLCKCIFFLTLIVSVSPQKILFFNIWILSLLNIFCQRINNKTIWHVNYGSLYLWG